MQQPSSSAGSATTLSLSFSGMIPKNVSKTVSTQEISDFFLNYIRNDNLGVIANAHLVWADLSEDGARCKECTQLASLHSMAVDFPKSGVPAEVPKVFANGFPIGIFTGDSFDVVVSGCGHGGAGFPRVATFSQRREHTLCMVCETSQEDESSRHRKSRWLMMQLVFRSFPGQLLWFLAGHRPCGVARQQPGLAFHQR